MRSFDSLDDAIEWHALNGEMGAVGHVLAMSRRIAVSDITPSQNNGVAIYTTLHTPELIANLAVCEQSQTSNSLPEEAA